MNHTIETNSDVEIFKGWEKGKPHTKRYELNENAKFETWEVANRAKDFPPRADSLNRVIVDTNMFKNYNYKRVRVDQDVAVKGMPHIFFTTPMCNMTSFNVTADSFLAYLSGTRSDLLDMLNYGTVHHMTNQYINVSNVDMNRVQMNQQITNGETIYQTSNPFIPLLYNTATKFDTKDMVSRTMEIGETAYGFKQTLPSTNVESIVGDEFSIDFIDLQGLPVLHLLNAWFIYHNKIRRGQLTPSLNAIKEPYIDYLCSVYYFLTEMDNSALMYWAKYTGVAPISVPFSQFSSDYMTHDIVKYPVNFVYSFKEDMNPDILTDFNKVSNGRTEPINYADVTYNNKPEDMRTVSMGIENNDIENYSEAFLTNYGKTKPEVVLGAHSDGTRTQQVRFRLIFT